MILNNNNPFVHKGRPITDPDYFFGRKKEIEEIYRYIRGGQSVSIIGPRRIGKTSLITHLCHPQTKEKHGFDERYLFVPINCQNLAGELTATAVYNEIMMGVAAAIPPNPLQTSPSLDVDSMWKKAIKWFLNDESASSPLPPMPATYHFDSYQAFRTTLLQTLADNKAVLLFDEFEVLVNGSLDADFFTRLRALGERNNVIFITSTGSSLYDLFLPNQAILNSNFFNNFSRLILELMTQKEIRELITTLVNRAGSASFERKDLSFLHSLAGQHPYLIQIAAYHLWDEKELVTSSEPNYGKVKTAYIKEAQGFLDKLWRNLPSREQKALKLIVHNKLHQTLLEERERLIEKSLLVENEAFSKWFADFVKEQMTEDDEYLLSLVVQQNALDKIHTSQNVYMGFQDTILLEGEILSGHRHILRQILQKEQIIKGHFERLSQGYENFGIYRAQLQRKNDKSYLIAQVIKFASARAVQAEVLNHQRYVKDKLEIAIYEEIKTWFPPDIDRLPPEEWQHEIAASMYRYALTAGNQVKTLQQVYKTWIKEGDLHKRLLSKKDPVRKMLRSLFESLRKWQQRIEQGVEQQTLTTEYARLSRKIDKIKKEVNYLSTKDFKGDLLFLTDENGDRPVFIWRNKKYINPVHWVLKFFSYTRELDWAETVRLRYQVGMVHGDLNFRNILVEQSEDEATNLWLIDFSDTHQGYPLRDYSNLEAELKFLLTTVEEKDFDADEGETPPVLLFEEKLLSPDNRSGLDMETEKIPKACQGNSNLQASWAYTCKVIRHEVRHEQLVNHDLRPYYFSLLHATLPIVYYHELNKWQRLYALLSAAMICEKIDDLTETTGQARVMPKP